VNGFTMLRGNSFGLLATTATCEVGRRLVGRLELPDRAQRALYESFEFWNAKGTAAGLQAEEIALAERMGGLRRRPRCPRASVGARSPARRSPSVPAACSTRGCASYSGGEPASCLRRRDRGRPTVAAP